MNWFFYFIQLLVCVLRENIYVLFELLEHFYNHSFELCVRNSTELFFFRGNYYETGNFWRYMLSLFSGYCFCSEDMSICGQSWLILLLLLLIHIRLDCSTIIVFSLIDLCFMHQTLSHVNTYMVNTIRGNNNYPTVKPFW